MKFNVAAQHDPRTRELGLWEAPAQRHREATRGSLLGTERQS